MTRRPDRAWRGLNYAVATFALAAGVVNAIAGAWDVAVVNALAAVTFVTLPWVNRIAFESGWREGRTAMIGAFVEYVNRAARSGTFDPGAFILAEAERDGLTITEEKSE